MNIAHFLEERGRKEGILQGMKAGIEKGLQKGRREGRNEGRNEGRHQGLQEATQRIALAMLDEGLEPSQVAKLTGLSQQQLAKLRH
jgi:predicted transposase/invertase (TIGR01784 family)